MNTRTRILAASGLIAASLFTVAGVAGAAAAAPVGQDNSTITQSTTAYSYPSTKAPTVRNLYQYEPVKALCYRTGEAIEGNSTWFKIEKDGVESYVHREAISPPRNTPVCK